MTLINVETTYTTATVLTAWPSGYVTNGVLLTESPTGRYTGVCDDAFASLIR